MVFRQTISKDILPVSTATARKQDMFQTRVNRSHTDSFFSMLVVTYHSVVRSARTGHRNAIVALLFNMIQGLMLVAAFYVFFIVLGLRSSPIRGDMLLFLITGVFLFLSHIKAVKSTFGAGNPLNPMLLHGPMNMLVSIVGASLATLYQQTLTIIFVLLIYHCAFTPVTILDPIAAMGLFILAWFSGCSVGLLLAGLQPWFPKISGIIMQLYRRAQMIASGKMFVVNTLPAFMIPYFDWNPLFHIIDQIRGAVFLHYNPHVTSISYPIYVSLVLVVLGMMGIYFGRLHASVSWNAGR